MPQNEILLSICIPTFNRSNVLRETLDSITLQEAFTNSDEIEIVVSDNASPDDTAEVVAEYIARFPGKVVLFRQPHNIASANFHTVMSLGRGRYLKLHNDNLLVREGALKPYVDAIRDIYQKSPDARPVMFMTNGNRVKPGNNLFEPCRNLDEFLSNVSFFCTWIGGFGLWREDVELASAFLRDDSMLSQVEVVCRLLAEGRSAVAFFGNYFISKQDHRAGYNWTRVFGKNYLDILKTHLASGALSSAVYAQAKQEVLLRHILPNYFKTTNVYDKTGFFENLADYAADAYFYEAIAPHAPLLWRFNNPHNSTELRSTSQAALLPHVHIGARSRGDLNLIGRPTATSRLDIGRLVTLGEGVGFVLGERPPAGSCFANFWAPADGSANDAIRIEDDVWIGRGALILAGSVIEKGAIVEAGSVVSERVPAYSRVAGNPARVISYRFEPAVIEKLRGIDLATLSDEQLVSLGEWMRVPLDAGNVDIFLAALVAVQEGRKPVAPVLPAAPVPAVLLLDGQGDASKVEVSLSALASGPYRDYPVVVLTTQNDMLPEWSDSLRYIQASLDEYAAVAAQLRELPDFDWVGVIEAGQTA